MQHSVNYFLVLYSQDWWHTRTDVPNSQPQPKVLSISYLTPHNMTRNVFSLHYILCKEEWIVILSLSRDVLCWIFSSSSRCIMRNTNVQRPMTD